MLLMIHLQPVLHAHLLNQLQEIPANRTVLVSSIFLHKYFEISGDYWKLLGRGRILLITINLYSAGQKFRTFNAMNFLWPPWDRGANFEHGGVWNDLFLTFAYYLEEMSSFLEEQCWIEWRVRLTTKTALFTIFHRDQHIWGNMFKA